MHARLGLLICLALPVLAAGGGGAWYLWPAEQGSALLEPLPPPLPVPPYPPRIAQGEDYERCLSLLIEDPRAAVALADSWGGRGGGDAARHCRALAAIAGGNLAEGTGMLEQLARSSTAEPLARAVLLSQAIEVRLQSDQPAEAMRDATEALALVPDDPNLLLQRAIAASALGQQQAALDDLNRVLTIDPARSDALVARAAAWRKLDRLASAEADIEQAIRLAPDDAEALLERGILRQRRGNMAGARADWEKVMELEPDSLAADLAEQNLALLAVGPPRR